MPDFTLQYVYGLDDFDTAFDAVPDELGARAEGSPPFNLQLNAGVSPQQITITDDDPDFNEIGGNDQVLASPVTIDGVTYPAGSTVVINYVITTDDGFEGFSITIGANNTGNNTTTAFITNQPMTPGQLYEFTSEENIGNSSRPYAEFACFAHGTMIATADGERRIQDLTVGDHVATLDHGVQSIRWIGHRTVAGVGGMAPVVIRAGTLGATSDLTLSQNHRALVSGSATELLLGTDEALVPIKSLVNGATILFSPTGFVTYAHLMFDRHEIIFANGCPVESLFLGDRLGDMMNQDQLFEIGALFPELHLNGIPIVKPARRLAKAYEGVALAELLERVDDEI